MAAQIILELTDDQVQFIADTYTYRAEVVDTSVEARRQRRMIPNPQTREEFAQAHLQGHVNEIERNRRAEIAREAALAALNSPPPSE